MKLFLALALVAVAAALPEPVRLPEAVLPQVANEADVYAVKFVNSPSDVAPQAEEIQVDAVKFVDAPEAPRIDAVKVAHFALEAQPMEAVAEEIAVDAVKIADAPLDAQESAPIAEEILADPVKFVEAPLEEIAPEEIKFDAVRVVDAPAQEEIKIAREPEFIVSAPVVLPSAALPVVNQEFQYGVRFVDAPQAPIVAPVFFQPMPLIDASPMIVPQQIMELIMAAEQARFDAADQDLPRPGHIFVDPMLR